jgi:ATP-dependent Lhr-like helicase
MAGDSSSFELLDERIQRYIWSEGWEELRDVQEQAIPVVIKGDRDVIISAATAAGKTEAAILPALTHLLATGGKGLIVYISPLKALINDQFGRLERLCEHLEVLVWAWHGDVPASRKTRFMAKREGVLLITPEALEALLCNRGSSVGGIFEHTTFFVVDELHAFIGSERGKQLQSLMHRIETALSRRVPRVGLSATLGDMRLAGSFLRPGTEPAQVNSASEGSELKVLLKGYEEPLVLKTDAQKEKDDEEEEPITPGHIAAHLFKNLRGSNNLIFPNSRRQVERYTNLLNRLCEQEKVPNEFWPHHGSLSKEIRAETEMALKKKDVPASAICTNTLELGIDIGAVKSVAQIGAPPSVASLRQRLGRSGRRPGEPAILRAYCEEDELSDSASLRDVLRLDTVQTLAMVTLLVEKWFEPPRVHGVHLSTLVQQLLSAIAQMGGASAGSLYKLLCAPGAPFAGLTSQEFIELLRHLGHKELITQESSGVLLPGVKGEKFIGHYSFYASFATDEEYRVLAGGKTLGTLPVDQMLLPGQRILFAGKTWRVDAVDEEQRAIHVTRSRGGVPPAFSGGTGRVHTKVRQRMRELLESSEVPAFLDDGAKRLLAQGRKAYARLDLKNEFAIDQGHEVVLVTWLGDAGNEALACLFMARGFAASLSAAGIEVAKGEQSTEEVLRALEEIAGNEIPPLDTLLENAKNLAREKWDWALPDTLLRKAYASLNLDLDEALDWAQGATAAKTAPDNGTS